MKSLFKVIIFILVIFVLMHYKKYSFYSSEYEIEQQELDYVNGNELYNNQNPLIITFIEKGSLLNNVTKYNLFSLLSFNKNNFILNSNTHYISHKNEFILLRSKKETAVEIINPKYKKFFKKIDKNKNTNLYNYHLDNKNFNDVKSIEIIIREYNILCIPRHWLFKFSEQNNHVEVFTSDNIFTYLFSKF